jgi:hypothetical protein
MPHIHDVLGKKYTEQLANSKFAKLVRAPGGMVAARQTARTLEKLNSGRQKVPHPDQTSLSHDGNSNIWQIWLQGWTNVPPVVAAVTALNKKANPDLHFRQLDFDQAADMVGLSQGLRTLYQEGRINKPGVTDLLRLRLIEQQGGVWLDATVVASPGLTGLFRESPNFFLLSDRDWKRMAPHQFAVATWAFGAFPGNNFIKSWADLLEAHWLEHGQKHYFDAVYCATALIRSGVLPLSDLNRIKSIGIHNATSALIDCWLQEEDNGKVMDVYYSNPLHKISHKTSAKEAERLVGFLTQIQSTLR